MYNNELKFTLSPVKRLLFLVCVMLICYFVASIVAALVMSRGLSAPRVAIITMVQDILVFIIPAVATAMLVTRRPAELLTIDCRPRLLTVVLALMCLFASVPAMNWVIQWNQTIELPQSMGAFAEWMRQMEDSAATTIKALIDGSSVVNLVLAILVVGVFAGFSEELFFRGALQRLLLTARVNPHFAIWLTAFIFSAFHMQFFGFVPRMLLGAFFGYLAWWSGSVWVAVIAHVANNILAATSMWISNGDGAEIDKVGQGSVVMCGVSVILTLCLVVTLYKVTHAKGSDAHAGE